MHARHSQNVSSTNQEVFIFEHYNNLIDSFIQLFQLLILISKVFCPILIIHSDPVRMSKNFFF
jgi:hypothetical protein